MKALTIVSSVVFLHVLAFVVLVNGCSTRAARARNDQQYAPVSGVQSTEPSVGMSEPPVSGSAVEDVPAEPIPVEPTPAPAEETKPAPADEDATVYVVKRNDSLWLIAKKHKTTIDAICRENGINKNAILRVGMKLKVPAGQAESAAAAPETTADGTVYIVKKGDFLGTIARRNGTTVKAIKQANNLTSDNIRIGQKLIIPAKDAPAKKEEAPKPAPKAEEPVVADPAPVEESVVPEEPEVDEMPVEPLE